MLMILSPTKQYWGVREGEKLVLQIHGKKMKNGKANLTISKTNLLNKIGASILAQTALKYLLNYTTYGSWEQCSLDVNFITTLLWAFCHSEIGHQVISFFNLVFEPAFFLNFSEAHSSRTFTNRRLFVFCLFCLFICCTKADSKR